MKTAYASLALAASSHALVFRSSSCCFHLTAYGGPGGVLGQLSDGQNRIGQSGLPEGQYCIANGDLTDGKGRGCILTPPTTQFQCDIGATPSPGFGVTCNGTVTHKGNDTFYSCPTGDHGGYNIYTRPLTGEPGCVPVWLVADGCYSGCPAPPPPPPPPPPKATCPKNLTGTWEFPHLIVPIDSSSPTKAYGTSFNGTASGTKSSIFNFDIPSSDKGKTCTLEFLLPMQASLETSAYALSGNGKVRFDMLASAAKSGTTYAKSPAANQNLGTFSFAPGNAYSIATFQCPAGNDMGVMMSAVGDTSFNYFQDSNPCPLGLYVTVS